MKPIPLILGGAVGLVALWSGGWWVGKALYVEPQADAVIEKLRAGDIFYSFDSREIGGFPFAYKVVYQGVSISAPGEPWRWTAPSLQAGTGWADVGSVALIPSDDSKLVIAASTFGGAAGDAPSVFDISADDLRISLTEGASGARVAVDAVSLTAKQAAGATLFRDAVISFDALTATTEFAADRTTIEGEIAAGALTLAYDYSVDGVVGIDIDSRTEAVLLTFEADTLDVPSIADFILRDGSAKASYSVGGFEAEGGSTGGPSAQPYDVKTSGGEATISVEIDDGEARYELESDDLSYGVTFPAPSPYPGGSAAIKEISMSLAAPLRRAEEPQDYSLGLEIDDLTLDEALWSIFDPTGAMERTPFEFEADLGGVARVLTDFGRDSFGEPPLDVETLDIRTFSLDGLGVSAEATGALTIAGDATKPDGALTVEVEGALALIDQIAAAGIIPAAAAGAYKSLIQTYGRPGDDEDSLIADIVARNGEITLNGKPLR